MSNFKDAIPPSDTLISYRTADSYVLATVSFDDEECDGTILLRQIDPNWVLLQRGGGALDAADLHRLGVPQSAWDVLLTNPTTPEQRQEILHLGPAWPMTSHRRLEAQDLEFYGNWELQLMELEIYARRGSGFEDPVAAEYFASRPWYRPDPHYNSEKLSDTEKFNARLLALTRAQRF